jgi:hypothetical protein
MKKISKIALLVLSSFLFFVSCKKESLYDELPAEFLATYTGSLGYTPSGGTAITNATSGQATIAQSNKVSTITFSNNVPSLTGLRFKKTNGIYASVAIDGSVAGIKFEGNTMYVTYTKDSNVWGFTGTK